MAKLINSFSCLFSDSPTCTHLIEHDIIVGDDVKPIKQRFYRVNAEKQKQMEEQINYMLKHDIAEPSISSWASPCLLVPKSDGTMRFCTDFRKVNSVTKPDSFPLPKMDDCIDQVGPARFVSKFDFLKGYWQVPCLIVLVRLLRSLLQKGYILIKLCRSGFETHLHPFSVL